MTELLKDFTKEELKIFKEEFEDFLPEKIDDFHVHLWEKDFYNLKISKNRIKQNPFLDPELVKQMKKGSVIVAVDIDQGSSIETARPKQHIRIQFILKRELFIIVWQICRGFFQRLQHLPLQV